MDLIESGPFSLDLIRAAIAAPAPAPAREPAVEPAGTAPFDGYPCPTCGTGRLQIVAQLAPQRRGQGVMSRPARA